MINIRLIFPYPEHPLLRELKNPPYNQDKTIKFFLKDELQQYDFVVVFDQLNKFQETYITRKTIFITGEPPSIKKYDNQSFLNQFDTIITAHKNLKHENKIDFHHGYPWLINKSFDELEPNISSKRRKNIILISSSKCYSKEHVRRLKLCSNLLETFGDNIDFFGRGINAFKDKYNLLRNYRYCIAIENEILPHYFTEKVKDCFLTETIPIYYGAPNISDYFCERSLIKVDKDSLSSWIDALLPILEKPEEIYREKIEFVRESKKRVLTKYTLFGLIEGIIKDRHWDKKTEFKEVQLFNFQNSLNQKVKKRIKRKYYYLKGKRYINQINALIKIN